MGREYLKIAVSLLNRNYVNRGGLDLSKDVLWVSVGQRAAKLHAVKVGGLKKNSAILPSAGYSGSRRTDPCWAALQNFFSKLHLFQLVTLLPFDIHRPTVPL